jgi:hypothetical protein
MQALSRRMFINRSERIGSQPNRYQSYVKFHTKIYTGDSEPSGAQFTDISFSGMRLISRTKNRLKAGDLISLEFTLPGTKEVFNARAQVIRCENEFDFAVHFVHFEGGQNYRRALSEYNQIVSRGNLAWFALATLTWMKEHRQGLMLFLFGLLITVAAFGWIASSSDEIQGRELRSWGANYPKEWFMDYYSKSSKP